MKLIVEIPDEQYNRIVKAPRCVDFNEAVEDRNILIKAIQKAASLDSIKAEIADIPAFEYETDKIRTRALEILDNMGRK